MCGIIIGILYAPTFCFGFIALLEGYASGNSSEMWIGIALMAPGLLVFLAPMFSKKNN